MSASETESAKEAVGDLRVGADERLAAVLVGRLHDDSSRTSFNLRHRRCAELRGTTDSPPLTKSPERTLKLNRSRLPLTKALVTIILRAARLLTLTPTFLPANQSPFGGPPLDQAFPILTRHHSALYSRGAK
jgi:hypothetical protein